METEGKNYKVGFKTGVFSRKNTYNTGRKGECGPAKQKMKG